MSAGWLWQRRHHNAGIVDVLWALGLGASAVLLACYGDGALWPRVALACCGGLWGLRLAAHLAVRVVGHAEDGRYRYLREHWHGSQWRLFLFFQLQALLVALFAVPFAVVAWQPGRVRRRGWQSRSGSGSPVSRGEALADRQLARFVAQPANRGKTCRSGLWRYSRHPNYFFEWLHWFTYVALAVGCPTRVAVMVRPAGHVRVPALGERHSLHRGTGTAHAVARTTATTSALTPMLFPWFPKES